jgi:hypothetical protein
LCEFFQGGIGDFVKVRSILGPLKVQALKAVDEKARAFPKAYTTEDIRQHGSAGIHRIKANTN